MKIKSPTYRFPFAQYPAVRLALLFALGIMIGRYVPVSRYVPYCLLVAISAIMLMAEWRFHRTETYAWYSVAVGAYLFLVVMTGASRTIFVNSIDPRLELLSSLNGDTVCFYGRIQNIDNSSKEPTLLMTIDSMKARGFPVMRKSFQLQLLGGDVNDSLHAGEFLKFNAVMLKLPVRRNPNEFDYGSWLRNKGIYAEARLVSVQVIAHRSFQINWSYLRRHAAALVDTCFTGRQIALAKAILFGDKKKLGTDEKNAFGNAGLSHLMAVSGLHVGFLMVPVWLMLPFFWKNNLRKGTALALIAGILFFYSGLTGFSASVVRASLTAFLLLTAKLFQKMRNSVNLTSVSALIILAVNPNALFNVSFQLSFSAVFIILLLLPIVDQYLPYRIQHRWYGTMLKIIIVSIVVQIGLFPFLAYYFHRFSIVAPLANAIAVPLTQIAVLWSLPCIVISIFSPLAGHFLAVPADMLFHFLNAFVLAVGSKNWSWVEIPAISPIVYAIWLFGIFALTAIGIPRMRWKWMALLLIAIAAWEGRLLVNRFSPPKLRITLFDVGQGDAILIDTPGGHHLIIDTGRWRPGYDSGDAVLIPELRARGIRRIDAIVLTHPHADHIGGMPALIRSFSIDTIYNCGIHYESGLYNKYIAMAKMRHIPIRSLHRGMRLFPDPSVAVLVMAPGVVRGSNANVSSIVLKIIYGNTSFLFTGDAEKPEEEKTIQVFGSLLKADFLKVGHHGSKTSSIPSFLRLVHPSIAAISVGLHNRYHLPSPSVIQRLLKSHIQLHYTSIEHALEFTSDGTHIRLIRW